MDREKIVGSHINNGKVEYHDYVTKFIDKEKAVIQSFEFDDTFTWYYATDQRVIGKKNNAKSFKTFFFSMQKKSKCSKNI